MAIQKENREVAIEVSNVKKRYKLGQIGGGTLQADLQSWWARVRGKEDPNSKIGSDQRSNGKTFMALNGLNLTVYKGEALGIIGQNGAGKSTLLKLLSRVTAPTEGEIGINGRITSMLEVGTGFNGEMTGRENVYLNGAILGMTKAEIDAKMEQIIEFSEVREFIDTPVKRYSSGMFVKLAFSVAAHLDSEIMIMDEVLAVGDMAFQKKCLDKMRDVAKKEGRTVLYVSHNMNTIRQLCDRCIVLDKGKDIFQGDVEEAIGVYMGVDREDEFPVKYDFTEIKRNAHFGKELFISSFEFIGKPTAVYKMDEELEIKICYNSKILIEKAKIVLNIWDKNNTIIGSCLSNSIKIEKGDNQVLRCKGNLNGVVDDIYMLNLEIITQDQHGEYFAYDNPGVRMKVKFYNDKNEEVVWTKKYWGNVNFGDILIH